MSYQMDFNTFLYNSYINYLNDANFSFHNTNKGIVDLVLKNEKDESLFLLRFNFNIQNYLIGICSFDADVTKAKISPDYFANLYNKFSNLAFLCYDSQKFNTKYLLDLSLSFNKIVQFSKEDFTRFWNERITIIYSQAFIAYNTWNNLPDPKIISPEDYLIEYLKSLEDKSAINYIKNFEQELQGKDTNQLLDILNSLSHSIEEDKDKKIEIVKQKLSSLSEYGK